MPALHHLWKMLRGARMAGLMKLQSGIGAFSGGQLWADIVCNLTAIASSAETTFLTRRG